MVLTTKEAQNFFSKFNCWEGHATRNHRIKSNNEMGKATCLPKKQQITKTKKRCCVHQLCWELIQILRFLFSKWSLILASKRIHMAYCFYLSKFCVLFNPRSLFGCEFKKIQTLWTLFQRRDQNCLTWSHTIIDQRCILLVCDWNSLNGYLPYQLV